MKRFLEAYRESADDWSGEDIAIVLRELEHDAHGRDHMQAFAHRVKAHGTALDLTLYQAELLSTHATFHSSQDYISESGELIAKHYDEGHYGMSLAVYMSRFGLGPKCLWRNHGLSDLTESVRN